MLAELVKAPLGFPVRPRAWLAPQLGSGSQPVVPEVRLAILRISELQPHEMVEPTRLLRVARSIASRGAILRPIIVEEGSLTVIDGHHRLEALRLLGARYAPVVLAAYGREVEGIRAPRRILRAPATNAGESLDRAARRLEPLLDPGPSRLILRAGSETLELRTSKPSAYMALEKLARQAPRLPHAWSITVEPEPLTPDEVLKAAQASARLPPRSTYHLTPLKSLYAPVRLAHLL